MSVDLSSLPPLSFAPADSTTVESDIISAYERLSGSTLYPGDPVRLFLESLAYAATVENNLINLAASQNFLAYAKGAALDHLGALMGVARIPAQPARCELRFSLAEALGFRAPVPAKTRVATRDGRAVFATAQAASIAPGDLFADVPAFCLEAGSAGSGLLPGQIDSLIDPVPYIASAVNITPSSDGADMESDDRLRERIRLAPESFTVAGSSGEYEARTLAVSSEISAVSVTSPAPGVVDVRFVLEGGELPDDAMISLVEAALSAEDVRPLTDKVEVGAPEPVEYAVSGVWLARQKDAPILSAIAASVEKALADYLLWQREKPGRDIVPDQLISLVMAAGAKRVVLESPVFTGISETQIAREGTVSLAFGGLEDD